MVNPVIVLEKLPDVEPSVVLLSAVVGFALVLQQMPLCVMVAPPFAVIVPPETAEVVLRELITVVVIAGTETAVVVNCTSLP
jgi:hypothetical protein